MWVHFLLFFLILLFIAFQKIVEPYSNKKRFLFNGVFIVFFVFLSFRAYSIGNDTLEYFRVFKLINEQSSVISASKSRYEIGYVLLNYIVGRFTSNFTVLLSIISAFYLMSSLLLIKRYAKSPSLAIVLAFTLYLVYFCIAARQCIAMAIFYFAIPQLIEKKRLKYCILISLAAMFHVTAIILFFLIFTVKIDFLDKKNFKKWLSISLVFLVFLKFGLKIILPYFPYFEHYYTNSIYGEGGTRIASVMFFAVRFSFVLMVWFVGGFRKQGNSKTTKIFNQLLFYDIFVSMQSLGFNLLDRFEKYFTLGFIICIVNAIESVRSYNGVHGNNNKLFVVFVMVLLSFAHITVTLIFRSNWSGLFPYAFI